MRRMKWFLPADDRPFNPLGCPSSGSRATAASLKGRAEQLRATAAFTSRVRGPFGPRGSGPRTHRSGVRSERDRAWLSTGGTETMTGASTFPHGDPGAVLRAVLRLDDGQWSLGLDSTPGTLIAVVVYRLRTDAAASGDEWLWVLGRRLECGHLVVDQQPPCTGIRVRVAALHRTARLR